MPRLPARVDFIIHARTGVKVALRLDKKKMTFEAEYGGQTYYSKDGAEVRAQVLAAIERSHVLVFQPVIMIEVAHGKHGGLYIMRADHGAGLAIAISRFYFSQEDRLRQLSWKDYEAKNIKHMRTWNPTGFKGAAKDFALPFFQPARFAHSSDCHFLPYSDETWEGLQRIVKLIEAAKEHLDAFLGDPGVVAKLIAIGTGSPFPLLESRREE